MLLWFQPPILSIIDTCIELLKTSSDLRPVGFDVYLGFAVGTDLSLMFVLCTIALSSLLFCGLHFLPQYEFPP